MKRIEQILSQLRRAIDNKANPTPILKKMEDADIATFLSCEPKYVSSVLPCLITLKNIGSVMVELPEEKIAQFLHHMTREQMDGVCQHSTSNDLVYLLQFIPEEKRSEIVLRSPKKNQIEQFLKYSEKQAGRIMQSSIFALPDSMSASESIEKLRKRSLEEFIFYIYCIDESGKLVGVVSMREVATAPAHTPLKDLIKKEVVYVYDTMSTREVAKVAAHYDFLALPVVNSQQKLLGLITMDDIIDIIQDQNTANIYARAGLHSTEKIHTSPWMSIKNRLPWMGLNLLLAVLASSVISLFEETMSLLIVLASLKNIVASMGGNTAIQTLTVTTRGMATGDFQFTSFSQSLIKELIVGTCMGLLMGCGSGLITYFWKGDWLVSLVIFVAMILNCIMAVLAGSVVPVVLSLFKRDPAVGSGVIVTMLTDIFGFFTFLGIARLGLYWLG